MAPDRVPDGNKGLRDALTHMEAALALLDAAKAPHQVGARLDFAIGELRSLLERQSAADRTRECRD